MSNKFDIKIGDKVSPVEEPERTLTVRHIKTEWVRVDPRQPPQEIQRYFFEEHYKPLYHWKVKRCPK